jgi:hypothetical protein
MQPPGSLPQEVDGADSKQGRPPRRQLPDRAEVDRLIAEMHARLTGDNREKAQDLGHALSLGAMERLGLIVTGLQPATPPQVTMAFIAVLKAAGLVDKHAAGVSAETTEAAE